MKWLPAATALAVLAAGAILTETSEAQTLGGHLYWTATDSQNIHFHADILLDPAQHNIEPTDTGKIIPTPKTFEFEAPPNIQLNGTAENWLLEVTYVSPDGSWASARWMSAPGVEGLPNVNAGSAAWMGNEEDIRSSASLNLGARQATNLQGNDIVLMTTLTPFDDIEMFGNEPDQDEDSMMSFAPYRQNLPGLVNCLEGSSCVMEVVTDFPETIYLGDDRNINRSYHGSRYEYRGDLPWLQWWMYNGVELRWPQGRMAPPGSIETGEMAHWVGELGPDNRYDSDNGYDARGRENGTIAWTPLFPEPLTEPTLFAFAGQATTTWNGTPGLWFSGHPGLSSSFEFPILVHPQTTTNPDLTIHGPCQQTITTTPTTHHTPITTTPNAPITNYGTGTWNGTHHALTVQRGTYVVSMEANLDDLRAFCSWTVRGIGVDAHFLVGPTLRPNNAFDNGFTSTNHEWSIDNQTVMGPIHVDWTGLKWVCIKATGWLHDDSATDQYCQLVGPDSPGARDSDIDGISDTADNCPYMPNRNQADHDLDGIGDACDDDPQTPNKPTGSGPVGDVDNDGVRDELDNCPGVANALQGDEDWDGLGDSCDLDLDGDRVLQSMDNCPWTPNPDQLDSDGDLLGDACDATFDTPATDTTTPQTASPEAQSKDSSALQTVLSIALLMGLALRRRT